VLESLLADLREGDVLVVARLDRLARSLTQLLDIAARLQDRHVELRSLGEAIDTTTSGGKLTFHLLAALAEFERALIVERTMAGLAAARAAGRRGGRPTVMTPEKTAAAKDLLASGASKAGAARVFGVSESSLRRALTAAP
jgi:DNA invertase Pin-like site-specific DNA recombinase